jgi:hypothetical protein
MANLFLEKCLGNQTEIWGKDPECSFCGEIATGAWHGKDKIFVCVSCATTILPKIIADATLFPFRNNERQPKAIFGKRFHACLKSASSIKKRSRPNHADAAAIRIRND